MELKEIAKRFNEAYAHLDVEAKDSIDYIKVTAEDRKTLRELPSVFMGIEIRGVLAHQEEE